jgi:FKBP-type peptidyl-prolyl cis-trans isomerase FkpA
MTSQIFVNLCRCLASAIAVVFIFPSAVTFAQAPANTDNPPSSKMDANPTQLQKIDTVVGTGTEAVKGKTAVVHYTGWLYDPFAADKKGKKFDSSVDRKSPFSFPVGGGQVIAGWDEGVVGMKVGGKRTLIIPAYMGYGARGAGRGLIPPNAILLFDIELLEVKG